MRDKSRDNRGFSLMELVVVISILAVMVGFLAMSMGVVFGWKVNECADAISNQLDVTKTGALSKGGQEMKLSMDASGDYVVESVEYIYTEDVSTGTLVLTPNALGSTVVGKDSSNLTITVYFEDGTSIIISSTDSVTLGYSRSSGAFTYPRINDATYSSYCNKIEVTNTRKTGTIVLVPLTGKQYIE